eukprot:TRINITY_DN4021_c7_g1_i1.p1 TRINITY_DN4021_c7_g1~~TRINITY_DN4021_c7_g1_i1.p1  ORF type:complete len:486 (+),score=130.84 TRINITY_DN4021_c7_g1_i1:83-1540(+)
MRRRGSLFRELDAFRAVSADLAESSAPGGLFTLCAAGVCFVLLFAEFGSFMDVQTRTQLVIDRNSDQMLRINFDVEMFDLSCDYLSVGVWDSFGSDRLNVTANLYKQRLDHTGADKGRPYTEAELQELDQEELSAEGRREVDAPWRSSGDREHHDFEHVINSNDFTFIFFYVRPTKHAKGLACAACKALRPVWEEFEGLVNDGREEVLRVVRDADGRSPVMRAIHINCADYQEMCTKQRVAGFPTIRLYRRKLGGKRFAPYTGARDVASLIGFMREQVSSVHTHSSDVHLHSVFKEGCRVRGHVEVARVPGTLHFEARHTQDYTLNFATTNVSHKIHHLSFGDNGYQLASLTRDTLPAEFAENVAPLDGKTYATAKFHQAPHHFLKVVATTLKGSGDPNWRYTDSEFRSYQMTHQFHVSTYSRRETPQAKVSYDLSPVEVIVTRERGRHWYDFLTCVLAGIGGTFSTFAIVSRLLGTLGSKRGHR